MRKLLPYNLLAHLTFFVLLISCSSESNTQSEQISVREQPALTAEDTVKANIIYGGLNLNQIATLPSRVVLTGLPEHRLITLYKQMPIKNSDGYSRKEYYDYSDRVEYEEHFMPGIDIIYGYNLLNIAHHNLVTLKTTRLFQKPVLVKTIYYPSFVQDSLNRKPINRNFYFVSVYDEDTNQDTLISNHDLRRFYFFNAETDEKIQLLPSTYSGVRSQYDSENDIMYLFARFDENEDGMTERKEPLHVFWISLKEPKKAVRMY